MQGPLPHTSFPPWHETDALVRCRSSCERIQFKNPLASSASPRWLTRAARAFTSSRCRRTLSPPQLPALRADWLPVYVLHLHCSLNIRAAFDERRVGRVGSEDRSPEARPNAARGLSLVCARSRNLTRQRLDFLLLSCSHPCVSTSREPPPGPVSSASLQRALVRYERLRPPVPHRELCARSRRHRLSNGLHHRRRRAMGCGGSKAAEADYHAAVKEKRHEEEKVVAR